ncbi:AGAP003479-PA-like protein [Anopheles sinensis]|uniref:AGAP003479-PA-like protein n=1 Tax=Anopheles sinensis TaxID=74873 RepID=A0A084VTZ1_ANOSI|nr:AGAP003479-PA-like protein [Anopheles sinensis]
MCSDVLPSALDTSSGTATNSIYPNFYPSDIIEDPPPTSTYPYFLFPSKKYPPSAFGSATLYHATVDYINLPDGGGVVVDGSPYANGTDHDHHSSISSHRPNHAGTEHGNYRTRYEHNFDTSMHHNQHPSTTHSNSKHNAPIASGEHQPHGHGPPPDQPHQHHQHQHGRNGTAAFGELGTAGRWDSMSVPSDLQQQPETVRAMGVDDNYHRLLDQNMALIETPLVAPPHAYFPQHYKTALYPYNVSGYHHLHQHGAGGHFGPPHQHPHHQHAQHPYEYDGGFGGAGGGGFDDGAGGLMASSVGSAPVDNILISLNGGNGDAAIEFEGSSYEHTVEKQCSCVRMVFRFPSTLNSSPLSPPCIHPSNLPLAPPPPNTSIFHAASEQPLPLRISNERFHPISSTQTSQMLPLSLSVSFSLTLNRQRRRSYFKPYNSFPLSRTISLLHFSLSLYISFFFSFTTFECFIHNFQVAFCTKPLLTRPVAYFPTVGSDDIEEKEAEMSFIHFQSTCHLALHSCRDDQVCSSALKTVMMHCDQHRCNRNACMESLQSFYKSIHDDLSLDIAFCLCRKTPNRHDMCMSAQEKLHPVCAQRPPESLAQQSSSQAGNGVTYNAPPACHSVAELCREDEDCRARLEVFEQSCAVDSVTKKCAGKTSACRQAMLGILGTPLRTTCACQGSDMQQLYDCLGWQRLLWLNPCVVESQKDFHLKRLAELGLLTTTTTMATTTTTTTTTMRTTRVTLPPTQPPTKPKPVYRPKPTEVHTIETNYVETPDTRPETLLHKQNELIERTDLEPHRPQKPDEYDRSNSGKSRYQPPPIQPDGDEEEEEVHNKIYQKPDEQVLHVPSTEVTEMETLPPTTVTTTTTEPTTTPVPIRYCVVQRSHQPDQLIAEGKSRRLYILDDAECSELCTCGGGDSLTLSCHALCVPLAPCRTALAYYSHAAPAYQAFRGRCLCYSGRFICMRPPPGEYLLPGGIFLLLGYSSTDEALLRPHTNLGVQDAVRALQQYVQHHIDNSVRWNLKL